MALSELSSLKTTKLSQNSDCPLGGLMIETGIDFDRNGELSQTEIQDTLTKIICNSSSNGFPPTVLTVSAENISQKTAILKGEIISLNNNAVLNNF